MRELLLLRHAKSSWNDPALDDFDRPLSARGRKAAPEMARQIVALGWRPDRILVSPALRTRQTWELAKAQWEAWKNLPEPEFADRLYMAGAYDLLACLRAGKGRRLLLIGHNPGLEGLALLLAGPDSQTRALSRLRAKFPTAALARLTFDGEWAALAPAAARLNAFIRPARQS